MFVETRPRKYDKEHQIREYFLGLCDDDTLSRWSFCPSNLQEKRSADCDLRTNNMYGTRVHRRLCDVTLLSLKAQQCDCNSDLSDSKLFKVQGFPTCFKAPLPDSLCGDNNVCGLAACKPETINKRIHSVVCDPECHHRQPFCEQPGKRSSLPREVHSFWTDWSNPFCTDVSCMSQFDEATCINKLTGEGDVDCLGPGTSCCPEDLQNCRCHIYEEDGVSKVFRTFSIPPPELVEYMSEEDFINSIPLRYLNKEEYHKYPYNSPRTVRANAGRAMKKAFLKLYDHRPIKFGNTHNRKDKEQGFKRLSSIKKSVINHFKTKRGSDIETTTHVYYKVNPIKRPKLRKKKKLMKLLELETTPTYLDNDEFCGKEKTTTHDGEGLSQGCAEELHQTGMQFYRRCSENDGAGV
ncbi:PREDICTED: uncharacterized protein LOC108561162 [Nicrophorus vespilloides]|uniref:Uncharacterized protein LOC108561162 n=1 Tax=Nicrophorus vespilloides TaxID=110193 RepID=A0ABM1MIR4_NICVS|nr:PREDICTED: uncharacterized protein LOC108561162 [Nicrophorus vespilloides]